MSQASANRPRRESPLPGRPVAVCGGGAAGMAAALAAARAGADVCLLEAGPCLGGTVANALIHTIGGLFDSDGDFLNDGLARELAERLTRADSRVHQRRIGRAWVLSVCPERYRQVVNAWIGEEPRVRVFKHTRVVEAARQEDRITDLVARGTDGCLHIRPRAVIDTTGTGEVIRQIDPSLLQHDERRAAGGLIFRLRGVAPDALASPKGVAVVRALRRAAEEGCLSPRCRHVWLDRGIDGDEVFVKLFVPLANACRAPQQRGEITGEALRDQATVVSFLRRLPDFADARVTSTGALGIRDGGRIRGEYCLTEADVRSGRKFADAACRAAWPIEYWDAERGVSVEYLPDGQHYEIPLRALQVHGFRNLWAAGKCLSADGLAHASARVAGTCWAMGEAVGRAAASAEGSFA